MSRLEIRTKLLRAIADNSASLSEGVDRIAGVMFTTGEVVATDGRSLLRLPLQHDLAGLVPIELVDAACTAQLAWSDGQIDEFGYPVEDQNSVFISIADGRATIDIGGVELSAPLRDSSQFPSAAKLDETCANSSREGRALGIRFDPQRLERFNDVMRATGDERGCWIHAAGGPTDAIVFRSDSGATLILMPMRPTEDAKEAA